MTLKSEIKARLVASLEALLDPYMNERGFRRATASLVYSRRLNCSMQKIDIRIQIHPKDRPDCAAAVYPWMEVLIPAVDEVLRKMVLDDAGLLEGITGGTSKQPIEFTSEKADVGRWFVFQPDSVPGVVQGIRGFIERWTMPLLEAYSTPQDIWAADQGKDGRIVRDRAQMMRVIAAAIACGRHDDALRRMDEFLTTGGARRRYQQVYDYIQNVN